MQKTRINQVCCYLMLVTYVVLIPAQGLAGAEEKLSRNIEFWGIFELSLKGPSGGNPFIDVHLSAEFKQNSRVFEPEGFYDRNDLYLIRFMPDELGEWTYTTKSNCKELDGKS